VRFDCRGFDACHHVMPRECATSTSSLYIRRDLRLSMGSSGHARDGVRFTNDLDILHELVNWIRGYMHLSCTAQVTTSFASVCCIVWYTGILTVLVIINSPNDLKDWLSVACQDEVHMTIHNHASPQSRMS
jgi:hypothetical protein